MVCSLKNSLIVFCIADLLLGLVIVSVAIWVIEDSIFMSHIMGTEMFLAASACLLVGGIVVAATAIFGLATVSKGLSILTKIFIIVLLVLFLLLVLGGILAVVFSGVLEDKIQKDMKQALIQHYGAAGQEGEDTTAAWDKLQSEFRCCGVVDADWTIYRNTTFFKSQKGVDVTVESKTFVPESCCVYNDITGAYHNVQRCQTFQLGPPANPTTKFTNEYLFHQGCYQAGKAFLLNHSWIVVALGFVFAVIMITGIILSVIYLRRLNQANQRKKTSRKEEEKNREQYEKVRQ